MSVHECPVPGCDADDPTVSILVNNSKVESEKGIDETDLTFDIEFPTEDGLEDPSSSITICETCYSSKRYLKD